MEAEDLPPMYQCGICQSKFLDPEVDLQDNNLYCAGCGVAWDCVREIPEHVEAKMFYTLIDRGWTRRQRRQLLTQFDTLED